MIHNKNMVNLKGINNMWAKYRHESKQTLVVIGFLVLSAKLCKADGHFNEIEEEEFNYNEYYYGSE